MIVDANILLYAVDELSPHHERVGGWWSRALTGRTRLGLPWQSIGAFVRITTNARVMRDPLDAPAAWSFVEEWLGLDVVWVPPATARTCAVLGDLLRGSGVTGNLVTDAQLAAMAVEHGVPVASADSDFARFPGVAWVNPLRD